MTNRDINELRLNIKREIRLLKWMLGFTLAGVMGISVYAISVVRRNPEFVAPQMPRLA